jgi:acyl transferase domain-containing protein
VTSTDPNEQRRLMSKAVLELRELRARVKELEAAHNAPIAIIGVGCRFPGGADDPASFWEIAREGRDATAEVPASRWEADDYYDPDRDAPGKMVTRRGGFIGSIDGFDAPFFGVSPTEARDMDPQHRLLMEVAWEALEHAAIAPDALFGRAVGVYVGICNPLHTSNVFEGPAIERITAHHGTGVSFSVAAGRVSHFLGVMGPSLAVDTACSSSLVALHLASQSLRAGECELALVGGVNLLLGPQVSVSFSKARMLSSDGRCKTFSADADGYGRGEGCGVVVLRRLSDALQRGERVLAVVRGSAVNHDGPSSTLTAPNGHAQVKVIRAALEQGRVEPARVGYLEAHGTGTLVGDPIEVNALAEVFGQSHTRQRPLLLGSVKANIGHLEAAAGISGLIKAVLALQHRTIPPHPLVGERTRHIPWDRLPVDVPLTARPWPASEGPRTAGVSSFGFSGTNVHVVLEEAPDAVPADGHVEGRAHVERPLHLLALSAKSSGALRALAAAHRRALDAGDLPVADMCFTANVGRTHFRHRACALGRTAEEISGDLGRALEEAAMTPPSAPKIALLFTGQGAHRPGAGRALYEAQPIFRRVVDRCAEIVDPLLGRPIREILFDDRAGGALEEAAFAEPALFVLEIALAELWRAFGVKPIAVLGHGVGEHAAACVAGVTALDDALRLVVARGRASQPLSASGDPGRELPAAIADELDRAAGAVRTRTPAIPVVSSVTGALADDAITGGAYWARQARGPERWTEAARTLRELGCDTVVEVGPGPALPATAEERLTEGGGLSWITSLSAGGGDDWGALLRAVSALYRAGLAVDWAGFDRDYPRRRVTLPAYPFERKDYPAPAPARRRPDPARAPATPAGAIEASEPRAQGGRVVRG